MSIFTQSHSRYTKIVKIIHFRSINAMKHIKTANTWNLATNAQPQIPTLSLSIKVSFQTCMGPSTGAPLGWRSASFFSHFSMPGTARLTLSADPLAFFKAQPWILRLSLTPENNTYSGFRWEMFHLISWPKLAPPWQCCLVFKMVFKQIEMILIRAVIQVFIFQFNLNSHNAITISLIPNIKQFTIS